jgi:hypothetical protein
MTNPTGLDEVHKKLDDIARLQDVHGKRLEEVSGNGLRISVRLRDIGHGIDRANSRLDLIEDAQNTLAAKLDQGVGLEGEEH